MEQIIRVAQIIGRVSEGGVERMIVNLYRHIDHSKVVFDFYVENTSIIVNREEIEKYGGEVIIVPSYKKLNKFKKCLKDNFKKRHYDIVHANMNALNHIPLKVAKQCGIKVRISHSHSSSNKKERIRHIIKSFFKHFSRKYPTHYFACSKLAGDWLFGKKVKYEIINNAIDLKAFEFNQKYRDEIRKQYDIPAESKVIGHIGRFCSQKNQRYLIDIFESVQKEKNDVYLMLVGSGEDMDEIKNIVNKKKLNNVIFTGPISNIEKYYNAFDCFVLPSLYEGLPVVGVEAQANQLKCFFSTDVTPEAKLLDETEFIDLKSGAQNWSHNIIAFLDTSKNRVDGKINNNYDINKMSDKLLCLYKSYLLN